MSDFIESILFNPSSVKWDLLTIKSDTFLKSSKFFTLFPINEYFSKKGIIIFCISDNYYTVYIIIAED
jgi:hypothetical protein